VANVSHSFFSWTSSGPGNDMAPGEVHSYAFSDIDEKEALSISVHPVVHFLPRSVLTVENVQGVTGSPEFLHTEFLVRNAGQSNVSGYWVAIGIIAPLSTLKEALTVAYAYYDLEGRIHSLVSVNTTAGKNVLLAPRPGQFVAEVESLELSAEKANFNALRELAESHVVQKPLPRCRLVKKPTVAPRGIGA
jgi:hypothetical protein